MLIALVAMILSLTGCYSIFSGGTSGRVVDADSTSNPKDGIANVDVYAYTSKWEMEKDYKNWSGGRFSPESKKYAHTITTADGSFTISKVMWKSMLPTYWRDGDTATAYILFYHEDYGLVKGDKAMLLSDTISDSVYQELRAVRQRTNLQLRIIDVATGNIINHPMNAKVTVAGRTYEQTITGTGSVEISYPRGTAPEAKVTVTENGSEVTYMMCYNNDAVHAYAFSTDPQTATVNSNPFPMKIYAKRCRFDVDISGRLGAGNDPSDDGKQVSAVITGTTSQGTPISITTASVSTHAETDNAYTNTREHGLFTGVGRGEYWEDLEYTTKDVQVSVQFMVGGTNSGSPQTVHGSQISAYNTQL